MAFSIGVGLVELSVFSQTLSVKPAPERIYAVIHPKSDEGCWLNYLTW
ncbi:MAG: hypothetical protein RIM23_15665 [Coleofasciculus sp. G3-WIS-01]